VLQQKGDMQPAAGRSGLREAAGSRPAHWRPHHAGQGTVEADLDRAAYWTLRQWV